MIIDSHVHLAPREFLNGVGLDGEPRELVAALKAIETQQKPEPLAGKTLLKSMDASGIDKSVVFGIPWHSALRCTQNNKSIAELVRLHPDRLLGMGVIQPRDKTHAFEETKRCIEDYGFIGIKLKAQWQGFSLSDTRLLTNVLELLTRVQCILTVHMAQAFHTPKGDHPHNLFDLLHAFPNLKVVAAHLGGMAGAYYLHPPTKTLMNNLFFDTILPNSPQVIEFYSEILPPNRLLFGSDYPFMSQPCMIELIRRLNLTAEEKARILGQNMLDLIDALCRGET